MTEPVPSQTKPHGPSLLSWLRQANAQVAEWAASLSWWRLSLLFLLIIIAGNLVVDTLNLKHDRVMQTGSRKDPVVVTIGGPNGIPVTQRGHRATTPGPKIGADGKPEADPDSDEDAKPDPNPNPNPNPR